VTDTPREAPGAAAAARAARPTRRLVLAALAGLVAWTSSAAGPFGPVPAGASTPIATTPPGRSASPSPPAPSGYSKPAYYRPVVVDGKAFPLARATDLSFIQILANWHAPRLRLIDGHWLLVGVHEGIDIAAERGTPVLAMEPGMVTDAGWTFYSGTRVGVRGIDGRYYFYAHFSSVAAGIRPGAAVRAGQLLGLVGNTGYGPPGHRDEFPPHLHFGIQQGIQWVDPYGLLIALYGATVRSNTSAQAGLDRLAAAGEWDRWRLAAATLYMRPPAGAGE
jgi:hypothetical protein